MKQGNRGTGILLHKDNMKNLDQGPLPQDQNYSIQMMLLTQLV